MVSGCANASFAGNVGSLSIPLRSSCIRNLIRSDAVATCTSDVIDGVEVDTCVGNPNANTVTQVPGVNVEWELGLGIGFG